MSLNDLVSLFTSHPGLDSSHQHPRGGQEGQVLAELSLHHGRVGTELVQHGEEGLEQAVGGQEGVGEGHPPNHRAAHVTLIPLVAYQTPNHCQVPP